MARWRLFGAGVAGVLFVLAAPAVSADSTPGAPALSGGAVAASGSANGQPASVSTGRSGATAGGQTAKGSTCGAQAAARHPERGRPAHPGRHLRGIGADRLHRRRHDWVGVWRWQPTEFDLKRPRRYGSEHFSPGGSGLEPSARISTRR